MNDLNDLFSAGQANIGRAPNAPDIPGPAMMQPNAQRSQMEKLLQALRQNFMMGGATDVRNMGNAMGPMGLQMAQAARANPMAQMGQRAAGQAMGPAEQMFDMNRAAPVMGGGGGMPQMPGVGAAGRGMQQQGQMDLASQIAMAEKNRVDMMRGRQNGQAPMPNPMQSNMQGGAMSNPTMPADMENILKLLKLRQMQQQQGGGGM